MESESKPVLALPWLEPRSYLRVEPHLRTVYNEKKLVRMLKVCWKLYFFVVGDFKWTSSGFAKKRKVKRNSATVEKYLKNQSCRNF